MSANAMRILHVLDHSIPLHSGYTFRTRAILEEQRRLGWETGHLTSPKHAMAVGGGTNEGAEESVDGLHFYRTAAPSGPAAGMPLLGQWMTVSALERRLDQVIERWRPDVIHAHSPALNGLAALRVAHRRGLPLVYEVRAFWEDAAVDHGTSREWGPRYRLTRALETHVLRRADAVTTICEGLRGEMEQRGIDAHRITVIPNAVDVDQFRLARPKAPALVEKWGLTGGPVIGFIGSFYAYEGLDLLLRAFSAIRARCPGCRLLLVGGGKEEPVLRSLAAALGIGDDVVFVGRVPHGDVPLYYDLIDVLVYPRHSMRLTELVTPLKPLEAMAQGALLVASDVGGHRELIEDGRTGVLFKAGDAGALADAVAGLLANRARWDGMRAAGRRFVEAERNWPASVARYAAVYAAALERR